MFEHKGVKIEFSEGDGKFSATVKGEFIEATSLAGMKKKIEKQDAFTEFSALVRERWSDKFSRVTIVGISKPRGTRSWSNKPKWRDSKGGEHQNLHVDSAENESALSEAIATDARHSKELEGLRARQKTEHDKAWGKTKKIADPEIK